MLNRGPFSKLSLFTMSNLTFPKTGQKPPNFIIYNLINPNFINHIKSQLKPPLFYYQT